MEKILVLGSGGHAGSVIDVLEREGKFEIAGYVIEDGYKGTFNDNRYPIIGCDTELKALYESGIRNAAMGIGYLGKSTIRKRLWHRLKEIGFIFPVICDPSAILSSNISVEEGCFIGKGAVINIGVYLEKMSIINTGAIIEHECHIGAFSHISVGSVLCGNVTVGELSFIGANATIVQGRHVGKQCIIGAGTTVRIDVEDSKMVKYKKQISEIGGGRITYAGGIAA